jgi:hypothetical protein
MKEMGSEDVSFSDGSVEGVEALRRRKLLGLLPADCRPPCLFSDGK